MVILLAIAILGWIVTIIGWVNEALQQKRILKGIKRDLKAEIRWYQLTHRESVKNREIATYKKAISIVDQYGKEKSNE